MIYILIKLFKPNIRVLLLKVGEKFSIYLHNKDNTKNSYKYIKENNVTIEMKITFFDDTGDNQYQQIATVLPGRATTPEISKPELI